MTEFFKVSRMGLVLVFALLIILPTIAGAQSSTGTASVNGGITAASRIPNSMEVWWIGATGSVQDAFWYEGSNWQTFEVSPAGSASTNGGITAVSRIPNSMEMWWIGANGSVQAAYWYEGSPWKRYELPPSVLVPSVVETIHHRVDISTSDWLPAGGWVDMVVNKNGDFTFTGHMRNSGFPNIHFALGVVLMTPSGVGYAFGRDHTLDGTVTVFGRNRDDDWTHTGNNPQLAENWGQVATSQLHWRLVAYDTLTRGVQGLIEDFVKELALQLGRAGIAALIALI